MTKREGAILSAYTGILLGDFSSMHGYVEEILKRPVFTHEFADEKVFALIKESSRADFESVIRNQTSYCKQPLPHIRQSTPWYPA